MSMKKHIGLGVAMSAYALFPHAAGAEAVPKEQCAPVYAPLAETMDSSLTAAVSDFTSRAQEDDADYDHLKVHIVPDSSVAKDDYADLKRGETEDAALHYVDSLFDTCEWDEDGTVVLLILTDHDEFRQYVGVEKDVTSADEKLDKAAKALKIGLKGEVATDDIVKYVNNLSPDDFEQSNDDDDFIFIMIIFWMVIIAGSSSSSSSGRR